MANLNISIDLPGIGGRQPGSRPFGVEHMRIVPNTTYAFSIIIP